MILVAQIRAARALLGWSQEDLAKRSGVSKPTIARIEIGNGLITGYASTKQKLIDAIEIGGVTFVAENGGGAGVRLRKTKAKPENALNPKGPATDAVRAMDEAMRSHRANATSATTKTKPTRSPRKPRQPS